ncbi:MAG: Lrp/AsnC ligand binding domain-containing protein [Longimicrobiales bacterium]|jgi:DNA-binding Lrp family transcriptional regulator|nr:Lrp/AsnC ligand binding domain-containing protein [Longimicrobiales bacterium]|tara:strand:+ start:74 stop:340 length:267 start_codon:yes stop_codon:yes gene_type:complete
MVNAVVLIEAESDKVTQLAEDLVEINGVPEVFSVAGRYDLVAILRVPENQDVADVVSNKIRQLKGVKKTETLIAFRVYSKEDIEGAFG